MLVDVPQKRGGFSLGNLFGRQGITCRVRCPEGSLLTVRTRSADLLVRGAIGGMNVATASGDVEADRVLGGVNVKSASGDVDVRLVAGGVNVQSASGDIELGAVRGSINVNSASGDVTIGEADDNVNVSTVSGDQQHGAVMRGNVSAHSVSGDVRIGVRRGSKVFLDCTTVSGDTSSELEVSPEAPDHRRPARRDPRQDRQRGHPHHTRPRANRQRGAPGGARMNRLSWDTTAPRRPTGKRASASPRPESAVEAEADIIRVAWDKPQRINPF